MQISEAESVVMQVLWQRSPQSSNEVVAALSGIRDWQEPTIKTLLNRLLKKEAIRVEKDGRRYLYAPALNRETWLAQQCSLIDRLFGGRVARLVVHFSEQRRLGDSDIAELRSLLDELDDKRR
jgi:BlaI family penicillinase repressor